VYIGDVGSLIVTCHDCDAVLWKIQSNKACLSGLITGHRADISKVWLWRFVMATLELSTVMLITSPNIAASERRPALMLEKNDYFLLTRTVLPAAGQRTLCISC